MRRLIFLISVCSLLAVGCCLSLTANECIVPNQNGRYVRLLSHNRNDRMVELHNAGSNTVQELYVDFLECRRDRDEDRFYAVTIGLTSNIVSVALQKIDIVLSLTNREDEHYPVMVLNYVVSIGAEEMALLKDVSCNSQYFRISGVTQPMTVRVSTRDSADETNVGWFDVPTRPDAPLSLLDSRSENGAKLKGCIALFGKLKMFVDRSVVAYNKLEVQ